MTLKPIPGLSFHEDIHRYHREGHGWLANSVTNVADKPSAFAQATIDATRHIWEPRGNTCHAALEAALLGLPGPDPGEYASIIDPLLAYPLWKNAEVLAVEYRLCDKDGRKSLGGSFDFLIRTAKGKLVLGDLKTVDTVPKAKARKPATAQLGAYLSMLIDWHPHLPVDRCVTVVAGPGITTLKEDDPDECLMAWLGAWDAFQLTQPDF